MLWPEKVLEKLAEKRKADNRTEELINDSWTPSGPVHIGSLRSPVIHDVLYKKLKEAQTPVKFQIGFDDLDPFDGIPAGLDVELYTPFLGKPLLYTPFFIEGKESDETFADHYIAKYKTIEKELNLEAENYRTSELYTSGKFDPFIEKVLVNADKIRQIYKDISGSEKSAKWLPFQPICENCGKLGSTEAISFDGKDVEYICRPSMVEWAKGCNHQGKISPFGGKGKMPWRVEWAAKWAHFGVTLEAAGKDHASKGSSFDVSTAICHDVFGAPSPFKFGHEFLTVEGKKMSSSKGLGLFSDEVLHLFRPEMVRFVMLRTAPEQAIEFDLRNPNVVLKYFDEFDKFRTETVDVDTREMYRLASGDNQDFFVPKFSLFVQWVQMPNISPLVESETLKGAALTEQEHDAVLKRAGYALYWLEKYAPEESKFSIKKELPESFEQLTENQKNFLKKVAAAFDTSKNPEDFQNEIYQLGKDMGLSSQETFQAIYKALIGKDAGPKAAWLILSLDKDFITNRFNGEA